MSENDYNLTCGQRWQISRSARPVQRIYRLSESFDSSAFLPALRSVIARHPALRIQLIQTEKGWRQRFPDQGVEYSEVQIRGITRTYRSIYAELLLEEERKRTLDLRCEPPVKTKVLKVNGVYWLSLCVDHISADQIGFDLFERELLYAYQQTLNGLAITSKPSESFINYITKEVSDRHKVENSNLLYWQDQLKSLPMRELSYIKKSLVSVSTFNFEIGGKDFYSFMIFCKSMKCSAFHIIVATQLLLLAGVRGINDIILNIPISNRLLPVEQSIIGNLAMLLHVRFFITQNEPIHEFLIRIRNKIFTAMTHRQYSYTSLMRNVNLEAQGEGVKPSFPIICNFVTESARIDYPNILFESRMDNQSRAVRNIYRSNFWVNARQYKSKLGIRIDWDADTWPISIDEMNLKYLAFFKKFIE